MSAPPGPKIRVLIVDDSQVSRDLLAWILRSDPAIEVVGFARDGHESIQMIGEKKPDVVTMDIHMPGMDGYEATRHIMSTQPVPIVIVSVSCIASDVAHMFDALEAGALAALEKPPGPGDPAHAELARKLTDTVKAMAEVRVVRRWHPAHHAAAVTPSPATRPATSLRLIAIGASTGGPPALHAVLVGLPKPCPVPVLIVQHISAGFVSGLAEWLSTTGMPVHIARHGEIAQPGQVYLAPDGQQMTLDRELRIVCTEDPPEHGLRPAVSFLFRGVARHYGAHAAGVLLTGMGCDGADALKLMRTAGAITFAQDKASSVVHGMPGEAIRLDAATHIGSPEQIAAQLHTLLTGQSGPAPASTLRSDI